jgi:hypothetical protein
MVVIIVNGSGRNEQSQQRTFHRCFPPSFGSFGQTVSEEKNLIFSIVFYFLLIFFTNFQVWEAIRVSNHKSESGSYMHHFHKDWWQLAFYRILKYVFWQSFSIFCNSDGHVGWQPEVFNQNFERRPHMHSFHMVWLHLTLYRILKKTFNEFFH